MKKTIENGEALVKEYEWFAEVLQARFTTYFGSIDTGIDPLDIVPPDLTSSKAPYSDFIEAMSKELSNDHSPAVNQQQLIRAHRLVILLALAPEVKPEVLDLLYTKNTLFDRRFTEFGGLSGKQHLGFLPTGETALFLLAGNDLKQRFAFLQLFNENHYFYLNNVLHLNNEQAKEPELSGHLVLTPEFLTRFTSGAEFTPRYSSQFPAHHLTTELCWDDLKLEPHIKDELAGIVEWVKQEKNVLINWKVNHFLKPGYRALFYGPPGTGKTLCATLLGQRTERPVYRIDLSQVISKYIGETEKNLARLFDVAENRDWILFFDEADALFGKRTSANRDAQDRYANQEVAYLLQRIENYSGLVILATNLKGNIDDAFSRRFQSMLYFAIPDRDQRIELWENALPTSIPQDDSIDLLKIAHDYEITGGSIINVVRYAIGKAIRRPSKKVQQRDLLNGIKREFRKEGKSV